MKFNISICYSPVFISELGVLTYETKRRRSHTTDCFSQKDSMFCPHDVNKGEKQKGWFSTQYYDVLKNTIS